jgi:energy-coupling factor transporter ATP-binding protein EcfA2
MTDFQNQIVGIVGRKGSGKSTRTGTLLRYAPRILAWDPMEDHRRLLPDSFDIVCIELDEYFEEARTKQTFACAYIPGDNLESDFEEICELVYHYGHMLFVIEEAPLVCRANFMPPIFGKIVRTGRHRGIDLLWTAQRASEVSRTVTSATDFWIFYSQTEPRDLDAIAERCGREVADKVAGLGLHDSFCWDVIERKVIPHSPRLLKRALTRSRERTEDSTNEKSESESLWNSKS